LASSELPRESKSPVSKSPAADEALFEFFRNTLIEGWQPISTHNSQDGNKAETAVFLTADTFPLFNGEF